MQQREQRRRLAVQTRSGYPCRRLRLALDTPSTCQVTSPPGTPVAGFSRRKAKEPVTLIEDDPIHSLPKETLDRISDAIAQHRGLQKPEPQPDSFEAARLQDVMDRYGFSEDKSTAGILDFGG